MIEHSIAPSLAATMDISALLTLHESRVHRAACAGTDRREHKHLHTDGTG
jgi:hypothetical protein